MNDRPTIRGENAVPPLASRSAIVRVVRVVRVVPTSTSSARRAENSRGVVKKTEASAIRVERVSKPSYTSPKPSLNP